MSRFVSKILGLAALTALATASAPSRAAELRIGMITPPPHEWTKTAVRLADELKDKTAGRVSLFVFPSGQLGNESQMLQQLQSGALDFAFLTLGEFSNRDPNYGIFLAPYLVKSANGARDILRGPVAVQLLDEMNKFGLVGIGYGMAGMRQIVMAGEVKSVADLVGRKIRTIPLAPELDFWRRVGAAPTPMPLPALYDAFANRQIDGMQIDFEGTWNSKYYANAGTIIASNHMMFPMVAVASGRRFATLSAGDRELVTTTMRRQLDELVVAYRRIDDEYLAQLKTTKVPVLAVERAFFGAAIDAWYTEWRTKAPLLALLEAEAAKLQ